MGRVQSGGEFTISGPLKDLPFAKYEGIGQIWNAALHPTPEGVVEKRQQYEKIMVPCFHGLGWFDPLEQASFEHFKNMRQRGGSPVAARVNTSSPVPGCTLH